MQASVATGWGFVDHAIPTPSAFKGVIHTLGVTLPKERLYIVLICAAVVVALYLFLMRTKHGRSMRATSQDPDAAALQGIGVDRTCAIAMGIGAALAAVGGALAGTVFLVNPYMGGSQLLNGLVVIVLGGMGSLPGIIIGAFMIGFTQILGSMYLSSAIVGMLIFLLLIVTLAERPTGLFGHAE
jgi:branched-chain amino acid transport system permease protein